MKDIFDTMTGKIKKMTTKASISFSKKTATDCYIQEIFLTYLYVKTNTNFEDLCTN